MANEEYPAGIAGIGLEDDEDLMDGFDDMPPLPGEELAAGEDEGEEGTDDGTDEEGTDARTGTDDGTDGDTDARTGTDEDGGEEGAEGTDEAARVRAEYDAGMAAMRAELEALKARQAAPPVAEAGYAPAGGAVPEMPTEEEWAENPNAAYQQAFAAQSYQARAAEQAAAYHRAQGLEKAMQQSTAIAVRILPELTKAGTDANKRYVELWNDPQTQYRNDPMGPVNCALLVQNELRTAEAQKAQAETARQARVKKGTMAGAGKRGANTQKKGAQPSKQDVAVMRQMGITTEEGRRVYMATRYGGRK